MFAEMGEEMVPVIAGLLFACVFLTFAVIMLSAFRPWLQAFMSGTPVSVMDILGMRLRRTDVSQVVQTLIMARQAGIALQCQQVEKAYLQGVDLEKVTLAMIEAKKLRQDLTFEDLVDAELAGRLAEKLGR